MSLTSPAPLVSPRATVNLGLAAWLAMFCSILIWGPAEVRAGELGNAENYYRILLVFFAAGTSAWTIARNSSRLRQAFPIPLLLLLFYGLTAMVSSLYIARYSFYSMWKGFEVFIDVMTIAAILSYPSPQDSARTAYRMFPFLYGTLILVYLLEAVAMPSEALQPSRGLIPTQLIGVLPMSPANALAFLSAITAFATFCGLLRARNPLVKMTCFVFLGLSLLALILAQSRTSVIGFVLALMVYLLFDRRFGLLAALVAACLVAALYTQLSTVGYEYLLRGQDEQLVTSLSGRTRGWEEAWEAFKESPIAGHGFAAYARANILGTTGASSLHGAVFDVLVGMGVLGLMPWACAILWTFFRLASLSFRRHPWFASRIGRSMQAEMLGVATLIVVRASTSSGLAMHQDNFMVFLSVLAYTFSLERATKGGWNQMRQPRLVLSDANT